MFRMVIVCLVSVAFTTPLLADWPQWRGPARDGHASGSQFPATWPAQPPKAKWTANIGLGYSGAAVARGKLFIHARNDDKKQERCLCLDAATGKQLWEIAYPCKFKAPDPTAGKGPNATPTVDRDRVYFFGLGGMLTCADFDTGKLLWQHDCDKEYWGVKKTNDGDDAWFPPCGASASPLVDRDTVLVPVGGKKAGAFSGFDRNTGKLLWSALDDRSSYAAPLIVSPGSVKQIVGFTGTRMVGLRYADHELLWEYPFQTRYEQTIVSPVVWKDLVVFGGEMKATVAVKLTKDKDGVKKEVAWKSDDLKMYISSPVPFGDNLIGFDARTGKLVGVKFADGTTAWTSSAMGTKHVSLVLAGNILLTQTLEGELRIANVTADEYSELAKWKVAEKGAYAHLAVVGNTLFVKGPETLACYEVK